MAFAGSSAPLERQRLLVALSTPAPFVALIGPVGAGATTLLRQWAAKRTDVTWASLGSIPEAPGDALVIDNADTLSEADWRSIRALRATRPALLIRAAMHSRSGMPLGEEVEFISGLRFTMHETAEYLSMRNSDLDPSAVHRATGGLPAAVRVVAQLQTVRSGVVSGALAALRPGPLKAQYANLAIPEVLTHEVVSNLGGPAHFIEAAELAGQGEWMPDVGHPLFRLTAPVRAATSKAHAQDEPQAVREESGRVLLAQEAWYGALVEGAGSGSLALVDAALKGGGMALLRMHGASIAAALSDIRVLEMQRWPIIAMAQALILNARQEHKLRAIELMGMALLGGRTAPAGSAERALLRVIESVARRLLGLGDGGVKAAQTATRILGVLPPEEHRTFAGLLGDLHTHSAISLMYGGQEAEALAQFERALATSRAPGVQLMSLGGIAMIHALAGDLITSQIWVETALKRPWPEASLNEYQGSLLRIAEAKILLERDELERAEAAIESVWHIIDTIEHWPALAHLRAMIDICHGHPEEGLERLHALRRRRGSRMPRSQVRLLDLTESSLALAAGDVVAARNLTGRAGDSPMVALGTARIEIFDGQYEHALRILGSISAIGPEDRANAAVLESIVLNRLDHQTDAALAARRARTITDTFGLLSPYLLVVEEDRKLFDAVVPWKAPALRAGGPTPRLTERERVVLNQLLETASLDEIATRLHVSVNTVRSQRRSLYRKLGAASREEALATGLSRGLLTRA